MRLSQGPTDANVQPSINIHGSLASFDVDDANFEPNFRHFDFMYSAIQLPNTQLLDRLFKKEPHAIHPADTSLFQWHMRSSPVITLAALDAILMSSMEAGVRMRSGLGMRWLFWKYFAAMFVFENVRLFLARERFFLRDFHRNQMYCADEQRTQRDRQRVREAIYAKKFVTDPITEYRVKAWQTMDRVP